MQGAESRLGRKWCTLLLALPLVFYLALPTRNFYWDGVAFAIDIEKHLSAASLVGPSHLAYALWGAWLYRLSETVGIHPRALFVMQAANCVLAGLCVILLHVCLRLRNVPVTAGVPAALVFGFSATWWRFAADANAYVPAIFFLLVSYVLMEHRRSAFLAGLALAVAILFHELAVLFLPVALVRSRKSGRSTSAYAVAALVPAVAAYLVAYHSLPSQSPRVSLFAWVTSHSPDSGFSFNPFTDAGFSVRGTFRLLFGGRLSDFVSDGISRLALAALVIAAAFCLVSLWRVARMGVRTSPAPLDLFVWVGVYAAFLFFWMPQNTFYRLFYLPPLIAIPATMLRRAPAAHFVAWLFVPVLLLWNFAFVVYPQSRPEFSVPLRFALDQRNTWPPGTPILFHRLHPDLWTISYFNSQAAWIALEQPGLGPVEKSLQYARTVNQPLWFEQTAYDLLRDNPDGRQWLAVHERPDELLEFKDQKHEFRFHCIR